MRRRRMFQATPPWLHCGTGSPVDKLDRVPGLQVRGVNLARAGLVVGADRVPGRHGPGASRRRPAAERHGPGSSRRHPKGWASVSAYPVDVDSVSAQRLDASHALALEHVAEEQGAIEDLPLIGVDLTQSYRLLSQHAADVKAAALDADLSAR
jgi:hypothetical protein